MVKEYSLRNIDNLHQMYIFIPVYVDSNSTTEFNVYIIIFLQATTAFECINIRALWIWSNL